MWKWIALATVAMGCADGTGTGTGTNEDRASVILGLAADEVAGETLYTNNCSVCHDADGTGAVGVGTDVTDDDAEAIVESILFPPTTSMATFADLLTDQEIADIAIYAETL